MKEKIKSKESIIIIIVIIITIISALINLVLRDTHAYYNSQTNPIPIFNTKVGDFTGEGESVKTGPIDKNTDVNIIFYMQMPDNPNKYKESKYVPASGYKVNDKVSNCYPTNNNITSYPEYSIKDDGTINIKVKEANPLQITCRIYYDRDKLSDIVIYAMIEDINGDKTYNDKKYKLTNTILENYQYVGYNCTNKEAVKEIKFDSSTKKFSFKTTGPSTCYTYFSK